MTARLTSPATAPGAARRTLTEERTQRAETAADVEALRPLWAAHRICDIDADLDFFLAVVDADPATLSPCALTVPRPGRDPVLVVARLVEQRFDLRAGYRAVPGPRARCLVVSFDGVLGAYDAGDRAAALSALRDLLRAGHVDAVVLQKLATDPGAGGDLYRDALTGRPGALRLARPEVTVRSTALPESWTALLGQRSAKSRRQLRHDDAKVERRLGDRLTVRRLDRPEHRHRLDDVHQVAARSYQAALGASVADHPVQRALFDVAAERGWLRVWMAYVDDRPAAFWWGILRHGILQIGSPGFDPDFAEHRLGYFVLRRMLAETCADPEVDRIDYGPGEADYKERFGTDARRARDVVLFAPRARGWLLAGVLRGQDLAAAWATRAAARSGRAAELRRRARARLRPASGHENDGV